jgi:hypothetical protein
MRPEITPVRLGLDLQPISLISAHCFCNPPALIVRRASKRTRARGGAAKREEVIYMEIKTNVRGGSGIVNVKGAR